MSGQESSTMQGGLSSFRQRFPEYTMRSASTTGRLVGGFMGSMSNVIPGGKEIGKLVSSGIENSSRFVAMSGIMASEIYKHKRETGQGILESARQTFGIQEGGFVNTAKAIGRMGHSGLLAAQDRDTGGMAGLKQLEMYKQDLMASQPQAAPPETERKIGFRYSPPTKGLV